MTPGLIDNWPGDFYVFAGLTCVLFGGAAWLTGQAIAATWRPVWQVVAYAALLLVFDRFLHFALFGGELLSFWGAVRDYAVILGGGLCAWRITRVTRMVHQYPWLYRRTGLFSYRAR